MTVGTPHLTSEVTNIRSNTGSDRERQSERVNESEIYLTNIRSNTGNERVYESESK